MCVRTLLVGISDYFLKTNAYLCQASLLGAHHPNTW